MAPLTSAANPRNGLTPEEGETRMSSTEASAAYRQFVADGIAEEHALALTVALIHRSQPTD